MPPKATAFGGIDFAKNTNEALFVTYKSVGNGLNKFHFRKMRKRVNKGSLPAHRKNERYTRTHLPTLSYERVTRTSLPALSS